MDILINITNECEFNCAYCAAREKLADFDYDKVMANLHSKLQEAGSGYVRLMVSGGDPMEDERALNDLMALPAQYPDIQFNDLIVYTSGYHVTAEIDERLREKFHYVWYLLGVNSSNKKFETLIKKNPDIVNS